MLDSAAEWKARLQAGVLARRRSGCLLPALSDYRSGEFDALVADVDLRASVLWSRSCHDGANLRLALAAERT